LHKHASIGSGRNLNLSVVCNVGTDKLVCRLVNQSPYYRNSFLANVLRYVRYMLSAVRLSSVCRLTSVCDVGAPYSTG